jgi:hypothetical protein
VTGWFAWPLNACVAVPGVRLLFAQALVVLAIEKMGLTRQSMAQEIANSPKPNRMNTSLRTALANSGRVVMKKVFDFANAM